MGVYGLVVAMVLVVLFLGVQWVQKINAGTVHAAGITNVTASADTYIREDAAGTPGNFKIMNISTGTNRRHWGIVRFEVSGLDPAATVTSATVKTYVSNGSFKNGSGTSAGYLCRATTNIGAWSESSLTWNSPVKPAFDCATTFSLDYPGSPGAVLGSVKTSAELNSVVTGNGTYEFYIMTDATDDVSYATKEADTGSAGSGFLTPDHLPTLSVSWEVTEVTPTPTVEPTPEVSPTPGEPSPTPEQTPSPSDTPALTPTPTSQPTFPNVPLSHGPYLGGVKSEQAKVFLRTVNPASVVLQYGTDPTFTSGVSQTGEQVTGSAEDNTTIFTLSGLNSDTKYYYRVAGSTEAYSFTTFPLESVTPASLNFAVFADLASAGLLSNGKRAPGYIDAAGRNPAFVGQIGDLGHQDPGSSPSPITISNWWTQFKQAYGPYDLTKRPDGGDFQTAFRGNVPMFHMWDDHDYGKNNADKTTFTGSNAYKRPFAVNSFLHYNPSYAYASGDPLNKGVWYSFRYGKLAEFYVLDVRSQRDPNGSGGSMLGVEQKDWLKTALLSAQNSGVVWKVLVSPSSWNPLGKGYNQNPKGEDNWALYSTEQNELVSYLNTQGIHNVFVISGDIHTGGAYDDGSHSLIPELSVPHTNINQQNFCTGQQVNSLADCGLWTHILTAKNNAGYGWFELSSTQAKLEVKGETGVSKFAYTLTAQ